MIVFKSLDQSSVPSARVAFAAAGKDYMGIFDDLIRYSVRDSYGILLSVWLAHSLVERALRISPFPALNDVRLASSWNRFFCWEKTQYPSL